MDLPSIDHRYSPRFDPGTISNRAGQGFSEAEKHARLLSERDQNAVFRSSVSVSDRRNPAARGTHRGD